MKNHLMILDGGAVKEKSDIDKINKSQYNSYMNHKEWIYDLIGISLIILIILGALM